jgi:hypothetical protein
MTAVGVKAGFEKDSRPLEISRVRHALAGMVAGEFRTAVLSFSQT